MIRFSRVSKYFQRDWPVLNDVNLTIEQGEFVFVTGKSGAGKSTLLYLIYMKEVPTSGEVTVDQFSSGRLRTRDLSELRRKVGMIFQEFLLLNDRNVYENIALPLRLAGLPGAEVKRRTFKMLAYTGLSHKANDVPAYLSSGEKQRVCIARALVTDPQVLLADEPTGNLDRENSREIFRLLKNINAQGTAVIVATHHLEFVESEPYRRIHVENGAVTE